jgi:TonB family protein
MKQFFVLVLAAAASHVSFSQEKTVRYFDKKWGEIAAQDQAAYYRTVEEKGNGFIVRDYFADIKKVQMVAECSGYIPNPVYNGKKTLYYKNGNVQSTSQWVDNKPTGPTLTFYDNGNPKGESEFTEDGERYKFFLSKDGTDQLRNGSAIVPTTEEGSTVASFHEIDNYKVIAQFFVDQQQDTIYGLSEKQADYKTGLSGLAKDLQHNIRYPAQARRSGIQGTVFVAFTVNKRGRATNIYVVKGVSAECDDESLRVVELLAGNWIPATHHGKPVATRFVLPVKYKLAGRTKK